jgi:hypothetical protein
MPTLLKAKKISEAITREIDKREKAWEIDPGLRRIRFEVVIGRQTGLPTSIQCETNSGRDLTKS